MEIVLKIVNLCIVGKDSIVYDVIIFYYVFY